MGQDVNVPLARAQEQAKSAHFFVSVAVFILALTAGADVVFPFARGLQAGEAGTVGEAITLFGLRLIAVSPLVFFALALGYLNGALGDFSRGEFFTKGAAGALREAGLWSIAALIMKIAGAPTLTQWIGQRESGITIDFDRFDFGVLALAMALTLIGRVMEAAAAIKADSDQIV